MPHQIDDLRATLFDTLDALRNKETPMDLDRARAVADIAKVIVDSAKVEVDFLKVTGAAKSTNFLPIGEDDRRPPRAIAAGAADDTPPATPLRQVRHGKQEFDVAFDGGKNQSLIGERLSRAR